MPRQELLSAVQRAQLLALPADPQQITACPLFTPADLELIARHRGRSNRLGFAGFPFARQVTVLPCSRVFQHG
jgi:hypothetical protein